MLSRLAPAWAANPVAANVTFNGLPDANGRTVITNLNVLDPDGNPSLASFRFASLPAAGQLFAYNTGSGRSVQITAVNQLVNPFEFPNLAYNPVDGNANTSVSFTFAGIDNTGAASTNATYTINILNTAAVNQAPLTREQTSQNVLNTGGITTLQTPLFATDSDGSIASYTITALPAAAAGVLALNGTAVTVNQSISVANAGNLTFTPVANYFGNAIFRYTSVDNGGVVDATPAFYSIPVGNATCTSGNNLLFYSRAELEDWTIARSVAVQGVTISAGTYTTPAVAQGATALRIEDNPTMPGKALVWTADYANGATVKTASVTFSFSRPLVGFTMSLGDIDLAGWTDQLRLEGYTAAGTLVTLTAADISVGNSAVYSGNNIITGTASSATADANTTVTWPQAISRVVVTYANTNTAADPIQQVFTFESFSWCGQSDVSTTIAAVAPTVTAGTTGAFNVAYSNASTADNAVGVVAQVQLPANLNNVTFTNITTGVTGTYVPSSGLVAFSGTPTTALAPGATFSATINFTAPNTGPVAATSTISTTTAESNTTNNTATASIAITPILLTGTIFDDVNYGGGAGRTYAAANTAAVNSGFATGAIRQAGTVVELYTAGGVFVGSTTTNAAGLYSFNVPSAASYTVRVVNSTVNSVRALNAGFTTANTQAVQTFVNGVTNRVGGEAPERQDAAANTGSQTLAALTSGTGVNSLTPQSITSITVPAAGLTNIDFGFNFDVITSTRDQGQGSLRQFLINSNALTNTNLAQAGLTAGVETSIFMIPNGSATPPAGLRAGLVSGLTNGVAVITPASALPSITDARTSVNGTTQTTNVGNTNNVTLGAGGTVGTNLTALSQLNGPEVQIVGTPGQAGSDNGLTLAANNTTVTGLAIYGFGNTVNNTNTGNIYVTTGATSGTLITGNVIGTTATSFTDPGASRSLGQGIYLAPTTAGDNTLFSGTISNNLIGFNSTGGIELIVNSNGNGTTTGYFIEGNEIRGNAIGNSSSDGIRLGVNGGVVRNNLFAQNQGPGVDLAGSVGNVLITNNTISNNGLNGGGQTSGVRLLGAANVISFNVISNNYGAGILAQPGTTTSTFTQNSIFGNGTVLTTAGGAASGQIGIDLLATGNNLDRGSSPFVTINDLNDTDGDANGLLNFPVITSATVVGTNLVVQGFARPGSIIEFFNPGTTADPSGFGEGQTYLGTFTEGSGADTNTGTGSYSGLINGLNQGTDNTNRFTFTIPLTGRFATYAAGTLLTSTATLANATSEFSGNVTVNSAPVPNTLTNATLANTSGATVLNPNLSATVSGAGNSISFYTITTLPATGTLTYNGLVLTAANIAGTQITPALLSTLTYTPVSGFTGGSVFFNYTVTDANGIASTSNNNGGAIGTGAATYTIPVVQVADVATTISASPSPVNASGSLTLTAIFTNNGPNTAVGYTRSITLPAGLGTNVTVTGGAYNNATGEVTFTTPPTTLASGANANVTINIPSVAATFASITASSATSTTTSENGATTNNTASTTITVTPIADVLTNLTGPATILQGQPTGNFTAVFTNNGPSTGAAVTRAITLPVGAFLTPAQQNTIVAAYPGTTFGTTGTGATSVTTINFPTLTTQPNAGTASFVFAFTAPVATGGVTIRSNTSTTTSENGATGNNQSQLALTVGEAVDVTTTLAGPAQPSAGQPVTYSVTFANQGPGTAANVTRVVTLPAGASLTAAQVTALPSGVTYNSVNNTLNFGTLATLASGSANTFSFTFTAPAATGAATLISNVATGSAEGTNLAPNTATLSLNVNATADVAATLTPNAASVPAGQPMSFTATLTNNGSQTAAGVTATVQLPGGLAGLTVTNGGTYDSATGLVTYPIGNLPAGVPLTSVISFPAPASGSVTAVASVSTTTNEGGATANNTAISTIRVTTGFDLTTTLTGPASAPASGLVTLNVTTTNASGLPAPNAVQTVQLISGLSNVFVSNNGSYNSGNGLVTFLPIASLAPGQTVANTISFSAPATAFAPVAVVTPNTTAAGESNVTNNTAYLNGAASAANLNILPATTQQANISTAITASARTVDAGVSVNLTVVVANDGPSASANVVQTVQLLPGFGAADLGVGGQSGSMNGPLLTFINGANYNTRTGVVTFPAIASLASSASETYIINFTAPANVGNNGQMLITAAVSSNTSDPMPANNVAATVVTVRTTADMATTITGPTNAVAGQTVTYTASFVNAGNATASGVTEFAQLPSRLTDVVVTDKTGAVVSGAYNATTGLVTFPALATTEAGAAQSFTISFTAPVADNFTVQTSVSSTSFDGVSANNAASITTSTTQVTATDVAVALSGPTVAVIGNAVTYGVTTTNNGVLAASNVTTTLQLFPNLLGVVVPAGANYNSTSGLVTFAPISSLAAGASQTYAVRFNMPDAVGGQLTATASVSSSTADTNPTNNSQALQTSVAPATTNSLVQASANIATAFVAPPSNVNANATLTLTASFSNAGPNPALNVAPVMYLPAGLSNVVPNNSGVYDPTTGTVTWPVIASQASGNSVNYSVQLTAPTTGPLVATSATSSTTSDPTSTNNSATVSVDINARYDAVTTITGPATAAGGSRVTYTVLTINNGPSNTLSVTQTVNLPNNVDVDPASISNGGTLSGNGRTITFPAVTNQAPGADGVVTNTFSLIIPTGGSNTVTITAAVTASGEINTGNNSASVTTTRDNTVTNVAPLANNVVNALQAPQGNTADAMAISPLVATDSDGTIFRYQVRSIPATSEGVLFYNSSGSTFTAITAANFASLSLTTAQAISLRFDPASGFVGNAYFTYTATDNNSALSNVALYTLMVGQDNASLYTNTPVRGGASPYANGDIISNVFDVNGGTYSSAGAVIDNGVRSIALASGSNPLPAGVSLNTVTGQLFVSNATALRTGTYVVTITTVDAYGGITTQPVTFVIGSFPLPVELVTFTVTAVKNLDAALVWRTATEKNNDRFEVERSLNGVDFAAIGQVRGQGTKSSATDYALTDAGIGRKASGLVYYRLKQVDTDGTATFSPVRTVTFTKALVPSISVYPNPATAETKLDLSQLPAGAYQVSLLDATGRTVLNTTLTAGLAHTLELNTIASGTYTLLVRGQNGGQVVNLTKRLIKE
ncbi:right-handed parallel beta-helix repeat-containing protein [Hymenobacter arizonensis]|uniref:Right handed beta helix region n=1 Tax=Hymenobacter arizonensis TaxID=1227077 RepID=A0A1I6B5I8_HYMAR|nr:right-handed parallel beta-helix repeat-containing protein [Hymenobacter arizonensis]SFQ76211.1 Right handed beta helix region [Hymenobacter arizonensis]